MSKIRTFSASARPRRPAVGLVVLVIALLSNTALAGQEPMSPSWISMESGQTVAVEGNLADGQPMSDLSWAWNSAVACFPETQVSKFTGHHVLYAVDLPRYSEMEVTVVPDDPDADFSVYAYEVGTISEDNTVPNLSSCIRCEADHRWDRPRRGATQDHTRRVGDLVAINNPYQVLIGVTGADGLASGGFTLQVSIAGR